MKTGVANLPLHYGSAPTWLFEQMTKLAREISLVLIKEYNTEGYLRRLADPNWFQAFGCLLGFDWHSSGLTTTTCGAIKEGLRPIEKDLGIFVCGGKGRISRNTPKEIKNKTTSYHLPIYNNALVYASKIAAKVDNNALQDGYQLYHHTFFFTKEGKWAVIQQGMNTITHYARRYHWLSENITDLVNEPHSAIISQNQCQFSQNLVLNLVASESKKNREITTKISWQKPKKIIQTLRKLQEMKLPKRHQILLSDIKPENLKKILLSTYEKRPKNFERLLGMKRVGAKTIRALSLISELIYGSPVSIRDPARYSFAHGGKDGIPYPVDRKTYLQSINFLQEATNKAKLGYYQKLHALRRLQKII